MTTMYDYRHWLTFICIMLVIIATVAMIRLGIDLGWWSL